MKNWQVEFCKKQINNTLPACAKFVYHKRYWVAESEDGVVIGKLLITQLNKEKYLKFRKKYTCGELWQHVNRLYDDDHLWDMFVRRYRELNINLDEI